MKLMRQDILDFDDIIIKTPLCMSIVDSRKVVDRIEKDLWILSCTFEGDFIQISRLHRFL